MTQKLNRVLSFDDFTKKDSGNNKQSDKNTPLKTIDQNSFKEYLKKGGNKMDSTKNVDNPTKPKPKPVVENVIQKPSQPLKRISKKELVNVLNNIFSDRSPEFDITDISWDFVSAFNSQARNIISKKDLADINFYNSFSDELSSLTGILEELAEKFGLDIYQQDEEFVDNTASTVNNDDIEEFYIDDDNPSLYESALLVEDTYKVKTTFDVPKNLLDEFKKKVIEDTNHDANETFTDSELAEQLVNYVLSKYLVIDNLPSSIAVGENNASEKQEKAEKDVKSNGSINVKESSNGLMGLSDLDIIFE